MAENATESALVLEARTGFTDGKKYDDYRPSYQEESVKAVVRMLLTDISRDQGFSYDVLELGAGTGKFTTSLLDRLPSGIRLLVSEPMGDFLCKLRVSCPGAETKQFAANDIPLPDSSVQAITAVQCFHWFADKASMDEMCRVLKPNGNFVILFDILDDRDERGFPWAFFELLEQWRGNCLHYHGKEWERELMAHSGLYLVERKLLTCYREFTEDEFLNYVSTISFISRLPGEVKSNALYKMRELIRTHPRTKDSERLKIPYFIDILHCKTTGG